MTLSSLLSDGPVLTISCGRQQTSSPTISWEDLMVGVVTLSSQATERPLEMNTDFPEKDFDSLSLTPSSSFSSMMDLEVEAQTPRRPKHKKSVSFGRYLEIREHALTIGDHPMCRDSFPLSLAWEHSETEMMELNKFEEQRQNHRRRGNDMKLSYFERKNLLRNIAGMTESEMREHQRLHESLPSLMNLSCFAHLS